MTSIDREALRALYWTHPDGHLAGLEEHQIDAILAAGFRLVTVEFEYAVRKAGWVALEGPYPTLEQAREVLPLTGRLLRRRVCPLGPWEEVPEEPR